MNISDEGVTQLTKRTLQGIGWQALGNGAKMIFAIVPVAILARILTPEEFGLFTACTVVSLFLQRMALFGIGVTIVQISPLRADHIGTAYFISLLFGSSVMLGVMLFSDMIGHITGIPSVGGILPYLAIIIPLEALTQTSARILQKNLNFSVEPKADLISYIFGYYFVAIPLAYLDFGVWSLVWAMISFQVFRMIFILFQARKFHHWDISISAARELLSSGGGLMIGGLMETIGQSADRFFLGRVGGVSALGFYGRAADLAQRFSGAIEIIIGKIVYPAFAYRQTDTVSLSKAVQHGSALAVMFSLPIAIYLSVYGQEFIETVYGAGRWSEATFPFQVLAFTIVLRVLDRVHLMAGNAMGKFYQNTSMQAVFAVIAITVCFWAAPKGVDVLSLSFLGAVAVKVILTHSISIRAIRLKIRPLISSYASTLPAVVVAAVIIPTIHFILVYSPLPAPLRLVIGALVTIFTSLLVLWLVPKLILGPSGVWLLRQSNATKFLVKIPGSWSQRAGL